MLRAWILTICVSLSFAVVIHLEGIANCDTGRLMQGNTLVFRLHHAQCIKFPMNLPWNTSVNVVALRHGLFGSDSRDLKLLERVANYKGIPYKLFDISIKFSGITAIIPIYSAHVGREREAISHIVESAQLAGYDFPINLTINGLSTELASRTHDLGEEANIAIAYHQYFTLPSWNDVFEDDNLVETILKAQRNEVVLFMVCDRNYLSMVLNLIRTSLRPFHIENFFVVATTDGVCGELESMNVLCYRYYQTLHGDAYGTSAFRRVVNVKLDIIAAILHLGYSAMLVDGDIVFFKNPMPILEGDQRSDIQIQYDFHELNSGFIYARPSKSTKAFFELSRKQTIYTDADDQKAVNFVYSFWAASRTLKQTSTLKIKVLNETEFPCGKIYFEHANRMFFDDHMCTECVIVHNNWIKGIRAKIYRFQELLLWSIDTDQYYSSPDRKYMEFLNDNPMVSDTTENLAFESAFKIAAILNRTLILPPFRCPKQDEFYARMSCAANTRIDVGRMFSVFPNTREHMFRYNPLSHSAVHLSGSSTDSNASQSSYILKCVDSSIRFEANMTISTAPLEYSNCPDKLLLEKTVKQLLGPDQHRVLRMGPLYGVTVTFDSLIDELEWRERWKQGFVSSNTMQL